MAAARKSIFIFLFLISFNRVHSESLFERSYEYVMNFGKTVAPSLMSIFQCFGEEDAWNCAKERAGKLLDSFDSEVNKQRKLWQEEADAEVAASGRSLEEMPSKLGQNVEESLNTLTRAVAHGVARALSRKHSSGGGIESITIAANQEKKEKKKKQKQKPAKIHVIHPVMMNMEAVKGGDDEARGVLTDLWGIGGEALDVLAEDALKNESKEDGIEEKSSLEEQRGKKKKKKKAILKLLILGAVIKAKIGTILAILSYKLQLKFFLLALIGLGINLARLWIEIKNKHNHQPQKVIYYEHAQHQHHYDHEEENHGWGPWSRSIVPEVIYYEHAQHQHHYDHEEENHGWGPWSRSIVPEEQEVESEIDVNSPYRGQEVNPQYNHPRSS